jgi:hypothetical protein
MQQPRNAKTMVDATQQRASGLEAVATRIGSRFQRTEPRQRATAYVHRLMSPLARKNGWQLAEAAGDTTPYGVQHLLGRARMSYYVARLRHVRVTRDGPRSLGAGGRDAVGQRSKLRDRARGRRARPVCSPERAGVVSA